MVGRAYCSARRLATGPITPLCQCGFVRTERGVVEQRGVFGDLFLRRRVNLIHQQLALIVESFQLRGQDAGAREISGRQQFDGEVGIAQAAQRVEARPDAEADRFGGDVGGVDLRAGHQRLQAQSRGMPQAIEAALQEITRIGAQFGHVGHDAQRDQIEIIVGAFVFAGQMQHLLRKFEGHAHARQRSQRMIDRETFGIDQRIGVGEFIR